MRKQTEKKLGEGLDSLMDEVFEGLRRYAKLKPGKTFQYQGETIDDQAGITRFEIDYNSIKGFAIRWCCVSNDVLDKWHNQYGELYRKAYGTNSRLLLGGSLKS